MPNWTPSITHISNSEKVNQTTIGRVTQALQSRTDYLYSIQNDLVARKQRLQLDGVPCASTVENYRLGYLNPSTGLIELADNGMSTYNSGTGTPASTDKVRVVGVITNKKSVIGGFSCDLICKGLFTLPSASLASFISENSWTKGATAFLGTTGKATFVEPILSIPLGISLENDTSGDYQFFFDGDPYLHLNHRHIRETPTWDVSGTYTLTYTPTSPSAVFAEVDGVVMRFDDSSVGGWNDPSDPDYTVSGSSLTIYQPARLDLNSYDPKLTIWYTTPFGQNDAVTGLVAGPNISLSTCSDSGAVATGLVTISSKPVINQTTDNSAGKCVKSIAINPVTFNYDVVVGETVTKLSPGANIYFTGDTNGQGSFTVNARPNSNTYELVTPEGNFLGNAKEHLLFDRFHVISLEKIATQVPPEYFLAKFRVPEYSDSAKDIGLVLDYMVDSATAATATAQLKFEYLELKDGIDADAAFTSKTETISVASTDYKRRKTVEIAFTGTKFSANSTVVFKVSRTLVSPDLYTGNFNILHLRLKIVPGVT